MIDIKKYKRLIPTYIWERARLSYILKSHKKVAEYWDGVIEEYVQGNIKPYNLLPKKHIPNSEKVIWQYWGQGFSSDALPEMIRLCFESVDKYKGEYTVIRLCDQNLTQYIELPPDVLNKYLNGVVGATHFTDLIRVALLKAYGGVWLDATILLTAPITDYCAKQDFFFFQRDDLQKDKKSWRRTYAYYFDWHKDFKVRTLSSIIFAKVDSIVINDIFQLLLYFWETNDQILDYFFFQIMITQYLSIFPERNCHIISDCLPNMLQMYLTGSYTKYDINSILQQISIHKLSYKTITAEQITDILGIIHEEENKRK